MYRHLLCVTTALLCFSACGGSDPAAPADDPAPAAVSPGRGSATLELEGATVSIEYGRPELNSDGTVADTGLTPQQSRQYQAEGFVWRLGSDEATSLTCTSALQFGDLVVPAGTYALFARKQADQQWELLFNKTAEQWGAFDYDAALDIGAAPLEIVDETESASSFTIELEADGNSGLLRLRWGTDTLVSEFSATRP